MDNPIKILFLAPHLSTGGMPAFLLKRIELLKKHTNVDIQVVEFKNYSNKYTVHKHRISELVPISTLGDDKMKLMDIIRKQNIDVVHIEEMIEGFDSFNQVPEELMKALYAKDRTWRIVETCHNIVFNPNEQKRFHPDAYALCTPYHMSTFAYMPSLKKLIQYPITDLRNHKYAWDDIMIELNLNASKQHVVNVGLWTEGKNQKEAVELARQMPDVEFHFIGNQAENFKSYWEPIMADLPSNCRVWGERDDIWKFMSIADVFMFNSTFECNPLVLREAIGYRCKILARNLPQYMGMFDEYIIPIYHPYLKQQLEEALKSNADYEIPTGEEEEFVENHIELYKTIIDNPAQEPQIKICMHFVGQPFLEILGDSDEEYTVRWFDGHYTQDNLIYETKIKSNSWTRLNREYYSDWAVEVLDSEGKLLFSDRYNDENKRVYIAFNSSSLGDTLAWIPYCEEYRKKHNCKLIVSTFWNKLFVDSYPDIEFVEPGNTVEYLYAMYNLGWFYDSNKEPELPNIIPLQKTATNILGLEYREIKPIIGFELIEPPVEKYVTIATNSTAGCKFWSKENWQEVINHLVSKGYKVVNVSLEDNPFDNCSVPIDKSINSTINFILHSEFFIGLSSGLSWLAWTLEKEVIMISNFTEANHEFKCHRPTNTKVCHGCWNNPNFKFDKGDWDWCPINKGTDKQFECQTSITPQMIIDIINSEMVVEE